MNNIKIKSKRFLRAIYSKQASYLKRISSSLDSYSQKIYQTGLKIYPSQTEIETSERKKREAKWYHDKGDETLRINYGLNEKSIVFDLGGYHGQWARDIYCKYGPKIHIFEPVSDFADIIHSKFSDNTDVVVNKFGLSDKTAKHKIYLEGNASSIIRGSGEAVEIKLKEFGRYLEAHKIKYIDLIKINIEGAEYDLLEHIINSEKIKLIKDLQIQFHIFAPNSKERRQNIRKSLEKTHRLTYDYPWVWENWTIK